jgi:hypothetical protein
MARLPARWGKLQGFFLLGLGGVFGLSGALIGLTAAGVLLRWQPSTWVLTQATWNTVLLVWVVALVVMRSRQHPRRNWWWVVPAAPVLLVANWAAPAVWSLGLVYLHPLVALWLLDRELRRSRPGWRRAYHLCLLSLPMLLAVLWWRLADAPPLPADGALSFRITDHAGAGLLPGLSTHLLVATHAFLEMLHYGVWILAVPLVGLREAPWRLDRVPLARSSLSWRGALAGLLLAGGLIVLVLWGGFLADYPLTRDVYFTCAVVHVLAEVPFLLRAL